MVISSGDDVNQGDIRLIGGKYNWEGRVEVYSVGTWKPIRKPSWNTEYSARVVCRQLGYYPLCKLSYFPIPPCLILIARVLN